MIDIYAGIVTYNPDINRLSENISAVHSQVKCLVICDNGSNNFLEIERIIKKYSNVYIIKSQRNLGIAYALNRLMEYGNIHNFDWMLTLDQDSICPSNYVKNLSKFFYVEKKIGIVAPIIIDRNVGIVGHNSTNEYFQVRTCISSGSIVNVDVWREVSGYDEYMFIDSVDFDFCYRVRRNGFKVIQTPSVTLQHELGRCEYKKIFSKKILVTNHNAFRKYYISRNNIYYPLKNHLPLHFIKGNINNLCLLFITMLYEQDKVDKIKAIFGGWKDGFKKKSEN